MQPNSMDPTRHSINRLQPTSEEDLEESTDLPELEELEFLESAPFDYDLIHSNLKLNDLTKIQKLSNGSNIGNSTDIIGTDHTVDTRANLVNHQLTANYYYNKNYPQQLHPSQLYIPKPTTDSHVQRTEDKINDYPEYCSDTTYQHSNDNEITFYDYQAVYRSQLYVPPLNFSVVENGIYRSGHPIPINFGFLQRLNLQTIIYLGDKEDQFEYYKWLKQQGIRFHYIKTKSSLEPFVMNNPQSIILALNLILDKRNFPVLIHSNKGKHRVGVLVGIMRKILQGWSLSGIFDEYVKFAAGKGEADLEFMELFNPNLTLDLAYKPDFVRLC